MKKVAVFGVIKNGKSDISGNYFEHISKSGVKGYSIFPKDPETAALEYDALVVCGGGDIHPKYYGQEPFDENFCYDSLLDEYENRIIKAFISKSKPILGICRGMQAINVALGGSLIQDIDTMLGLCHKSTGEELRHEIKISKNSGLSSVFGIRAIVNSDHHQSVHRLGKGLRIAASAHDGVTEAIEGVSLPILGVQWHPERMYGNALFDYFFSKN